MDIPADQLEVYTQFGIAAELAQALEVRAGNVALAYLSLLLSTDEITPEQTEQTEGFRSIIEDLNRKPLGQLLRGVKQIAAFGETFLETVDEALVKRNYLMHHFYSFHYFALLNVEGRKEMIAELDEIQKKLYGAIVLLGGLYDTIRHLKPSFPPSGGHPRGREGHPGDLAIPCGTGHP